GYFAEQSIHYIHNICKEKKCLLIEDASGALGDRELCDGEHADMIVGSFGRWKVADAGYGGFISGRKELIDEGKEAFSLTTFHPRDETVVKKLEEAPERLKALLALQAEVKEELEKMELNVVHKDLRGLNVVVRFTSEAEKEMIIDHCKEKGYEYVTCPNYIRLEEDAISIELKRLQVSNGKKKQR
ncbi:TPA: hypothetical protein HA265_06545, partial [Candidatus Woesearchaeota archaeon]|nr:hypothetical protein [Candidatus Woesearchaeota archaeon]